MLLAIDTATRYASVALYNEKGILSEATWYSSGNHSIEVMPTIVAMMERQGFAPQDLSAVAVAKGPGSFTGLRIGMSLAKGLALGLGIPIVAIPTLEITAYAVGDRGCRIFAVLEAGRGRICVGSYRYAEGWPVPCDEVALYDALLWQPDLSEKVVVAGEIDARLEQHLRALPRAENLIFAPKAGSLRRAGFLAELAWERLRREEQDDLDTLSLIYLQTASSQRSG